MIESELLEFKSSLADEDGILTSLVAFANKKGGAVYIGLNDKGNAIGVTVGKNTIERLAQLISKNIDPPLFPQISIQDYEGKTVIKVEIAESKHKPHFYKGKGFIRVGKANILLSSNSIRQLVLEQAAISFEDRIVPECNLQEDLDYALIGDYIAKAVDAGRLSKESGKKPLQVLTQLNLIKEGKATMALILLFAKQPQRFIPYYSVKIAALASDVFSIENLIYNDEFSLPLFKLADDLIPKIQQFIPRRVTLDGIRRIEKPMIPLNVLREFLLNALMHADYSIPSSTRVIIGKTYLKITNSGSSLLAPLDSLYGDHNSFLRNPKIANVFFTAGYVERFGQGTTMALNALILNGSAIPIFEEKNQTFTVNMSFILDDVYSTLLSKLETEKSIVDLASELKIPQRTLRNKVKFLISNSLIKVIKKGRTVKYLQKSK